jgi:hypothetical protein
MNNTIKTTELKAKVRRRFFVKCFVIAILIWYVSSYTICTLYGQYKWSQSGNERWNLTGLAVTDIVIWCPQNMWFEYPFINIDGEVSSRGDVWGYIYSPLILLDRYLWHPTYDIDEYYKQ